MADSFDHLLGNVDRSSRQLCVYNGEHHEPETLIKCQGAVFHTCNRKLRRNEGSVSEVSGVASGGIRARRYNVDYVQRAVAVTTTTVNAK